MNEIAILNVRTRYEWAEIINADWRKSIEGIIQTGRDLVAAKAELPKGEFGKMVEADCHFSGSAARALMRISRRYEMWISVVGERQRGAVLPSSWTTLGKLSRLSDDDFKDAHGRGLITSDMSREKAAAVGRIYATPDDGAVGEGKSPSMLPSPKEAREIARATNRMVAANDGNLYSGATDEEGAEHVRLRTQTYGVIDAINTIVDIGIFPKQWCEEAKEHWLYRFEYGRIAVAQTWLEALRMEFMQQKRIYDCKGKADGE